MQYFKEPYTPESLKKQYYQLALQHHPDKGGNLETMQQVNAEYDRLTKSPSKKYRGIKYDDLKTMEDWLRSKGFSSISIAYLYLGAAFLEIYLRTRKR